MDKPLVSVIMPVYNGEKNIVQAVESVFLQNVPLELIVVDDCSKDGTRAKLRPYLEREDFHYFRNKKRSGAAESRNRGMVEAAGQYIAYLDADDCWEREKLQVQLKKIKETGYVMCSTGRELIRADGQSIGKYIGVKAIVNYTELLKHNSINCSSVLIKKEVALEFPMSCDDSHEDYITWLKILKKYGQCAGINEPYLKYRLSDGGKSRNKWKSAKRTWRVYRYMGFGTVKSGLFFLSYALHGVFKYYKTLL